jgi:hypothetical protein
MRRVLALPATTGILDAFSRLGLGQKLFPAVLAAKIKRFSVTFGAESRRFVHRHSANRVSGHNSIPFLRHFIAGAIQAADQSF